MTFWMIERNPTKASANKADKWDLLLLNFTLFRKWPRQLQLIAVIGAMIHRQLTHSESVGQEVSIAEGPRNSRYEARNTNVKAGFLKSCNIN